MEESPGDPWSENRTSDTPLLEGEMQYNAKNQQSLRCLARQTLDYMPILEANLLRGQGAGSPLGTTKYDGLLSAAFEHWVSAGRPLGQRWVAVFFEFLLLEDEKTSPVLGS